MTIVTKKRILAASALCALMTASGARAASADAIAKLEAMVDGARLASNELWRRSAKRRAVKRAARPAARRRAAHSAARAAR